MKILQINKYHYVKGGADSVFFNTIKLLERNGHNVIPFSIIHPRNESSKYSEYFVYAPEIRDQSVFGKVKGISRYFLNKDAVIKIEELIKKEKPDIAHIHNIFNGISLYILPVLRRYGIPTVITMHETRFICPSSYFNLRGRLCELCKKTVYLNCIIYKCYQDNIVNSLMCALEMFHKEYIFNYDKYISKYIFVSKRYKQLHSARHKYFEKKGVVLYNFLPEIKYINPNPHKGSYLFYFGRLTAEKGVETLVNAMKLLPDLKLKMAGNGPLLDLLKREALPNIELLGFVSGDTLVEQIQNASYIIVPSEWEENNPMTVIEAYSLGKPVIGANIGGLPEIINNGKTGFIFKAFDEYDLAKTISKAMDVSNIVYEDLSGSARKFADEHFDADTHYKKLIDIYNIAIQENRNENI